MRIGLGLGLFWKIGNNVHLLEILGWIGWIVLYYVFFFYSFLVERKD